MSSVFLRAAVLTGICCSFLPAQTLDDATMLPTGTLFAGYLYSHDSWDMYWQGPTKRSNGNLGTVSTQASRIYADYGVTSRINVIASVPWVWTNATQGVLASQQGWQDLTVGVKVRALTKKIGEMGAFSVFGAGVSDTQLHARLHASLDRFA